jgi:hypothetical protein
MDNIPATNMHSTTTSPSTTAENSRAATPATTTDPAGDRRPSGFDSAPGSGVWDGDKQKQHTSFIKKVLDNKTTPHFLK